MHSIVIAKQNYDKPNALTRLMLQGNTGDACDFWCYNSMNMQWSTDLEKLQESEGSSNATQLPTRTWNSFNLITGTITEDSMMTAATSK